MRLLNVATMKLEEYFGSQIPKYAILSHCWAADEITFQDINLSDWRTMRGASKIEHASAYCRSQNQTYIWIDTCCIDKSSSAELSEAINSMYSWYERAVICYAYLEDVNGIVRPEGLEGGSACLDDVVEDEIRRSRWFTRGWTLQELIAPQTVAFFNKNWSHLGDKRSLWALLSKITTILPSVLLNPSQITSCSVARKMSWAASRETTRDEDVAYCLLGIFGVNMPLLYGEGMRAFIRLQEEIVKESDDQSIFAWGLLEQSWGRPWPIRILENGDKSAGVLAVHPAYFAGSANIVPFPSEPDRQPFSMTNRGLRIELPMLNHSSFGTSSVAMLNCHYENDFSGVIAIFLDETENTSTFARSLDPGGFKYPIKTAKEAEMRTIYIKKQYSTLNKYQTLKCLIRCESLEAQGYHIFQVYQKASWNEKTMVLELNAPSLSEDYFVSSSVIFKGYTTDRQNSYFAVTLGLWDNSEVVLVPRLKRFVEIVPKSDDVILGNWLGKFMAQPWFGGRPKVSSSMESRDHRVLELPNTGNSAPLTISAKASEEEILNQKVTVLEVKFV
ncbi:heterokaryon incompatibility protein-domain-containing protein [Bisporella sp. PMI_857]|nr:heterokaryon incompatibility protein-domain-containing protein [Bisporella sp. PMI_857]